MKLDEKRMVVEVLLHTDAGSGCVATSRWCGFEDRYGQLSAQQWCDAYVTTDAPYEVVALEAAYRLIESSPTLRAEWFGAR